MNSKILKAIGLRICKFKALILICSLLLPISNLYSQEEINLTGPRVGVTYLTGEMFDHPMDGCGFGGASLRDKFGDFPLISQFGFHFESILLSTEGVQGTIGFLIFVGGLDRGVFMPSGCFLVGVRGPGGYEIGVGPGVSLNPVPIGVSASGVSVSLVVGGGRTFNIGKLYIPLDLAISLGGGSPSISLSTGFAFKQKSEKSEY